MTFNAQRAWEWLLDNGHHFYLETGEVSAHEVDFSCADWDEDACLESLCNYLGLDSSLQETGDLVGPLVARYAEYYT